MKRYVLILPLLCTALFIPARAADSAPRRFDLPAGEAARTLPLFAEQSGRGLVLASETAQGVRTPALRGEHAPAAALARLLADTDLVAAEDRMTGAFAISRRNHPPAPASATAPLSSTTAAGATGAITGRVLNPDNGEFVENARVTVEGTALATLTDATGTYRLARVPTGPVRVSAFRTGAPTATLPVIVPSGGEVAQDFSLPARGDSVVRLAEFVVGTSKEMTGAAIAINTQRFAPNIMNVVAADEFGPVASGNIGEVLRSVPGVTLNPGGLGAPYTISLNGVPPNNVPVTVGGISIADSAQATGRASGIHQLSINNMARIEVAYTPTPETTGSALAGSVNLVPRSALERTRPIYNVSAAVMMRDRERSLRKTPGPRREGTRKLGPDLNFSAVVPLSRRFGFTLSASTSSTFAPNPFLQNTWAGVGAATNGNTLPDTTPDRPYLTTYAVRDRIAFIGRTTGAITFDAQLTPRDRVTLSLQHGAFRSPQDNHTLTYVVGRTTAGNFSPTFTRGFAGAGEIRLNGMANHQDDQFWMPSINWWHDGPVWKAEAGAGFSSSIRYTTDLQNSYFGTTVARRQGVTVSFEDVTAERPGRIIVSDGATGAAIDPHNIAGYSLVTAGANNARRAAVQRKAFGSVRRDYGGAVPFTAKAGFDLNQSLRDIRVSNPNFTFVGADGRANSPDDAAAPVRDPGLSARNGIFGFPPTDRVSADRLFDLYRASPNQFQVPEASLHTGAVAASKYAEELISAVYFRGDTALLQGRLKLVGGLRAEQTNAQGQGQLIDPTRNFRRNAAGQPVPIAAAGSLEAVRLTNIDRGLRAEKEYLRWFPSLNASLNLRENLIARAGTYWSVGRPDMVQYAGSLTLPNTDNPPAPNNVIVVNNAGIKAWSAQTVKATLEYYFPEVGLISVGGFVRDIEDFFSRTTIRTTPEFLALYGLDPATYGAYDTTTERNLSGRVRMSGVDVNYKQALTFLPAWARGMQVFANASAQRATGEAADNFSGYLPRSASWGVSLARPNFTLRLKWNYAGRARRGLVAAGRGIDPGTYNWGARRLLTDLSGEYVLRRQTAFFFNLSNLDNAALDVEVAGPNTPAFARLAQRQFTGALWTIGVKSSF
jgi:TonB-dependent receptor